MYEFALLTRKIQYMLLFRYTSKVLLQKIIEEILIKYELLLHSESISFKKNYFFRGKCYFFQQQFSHLTSINLLQLQSKTIVFFAKFLTHFSPIEHEYDLKSPCFVKKNHIYQIKSFFCLPHPIDKFLKVNRKVSTLVNLPFG